MFFTLKNASCFRKFSYFWACKTAITHFYGQLSQSIFSPRRRCRGVAPFLLRLHRKPLRRPPRRGRPGVRPCQSGSRSHERHQPPRHAGVRRAGERQGRFLKGCHLPHHGANATRLHLRPPRLHRLRRLPGRKHDLHRGLRQLHRRFHRSEQTPLIRLQFLHRP